MNSSEQEKKFSPWDWQAAVDHDRQKHQQDEVQRKQRRTAPKAPVTAEVLRNRILRDRWNSPWCKPGGL